MSQLTASDGQPGNWEEPDFFLYQLETVRFQAYGWWERYDGRPSRTVLRGPGGEIPLGYSTQPCEYFRIFCNIPYPRRLKPIS